MFGVLLLLSLSGGAFGQSATPAVLAASTLDATVTEGDYVRSVWRCDPAADPDVYHVNVPRRTSEVTFRTDKGELRFTTRFGDVHDFTMVVDGGPRCRARVSANDDPDSVRIARSTSPAPHAIPFVLKGSRVYLVGRLNDDRPVDIQLDLGAGTNVVNQAVAERLAMAFDARTLVSNTQGIAEARTSLHNRLRIGEFEWNDVPITEVGNMRPDEDLIVGNALFRDRIIELDYDRLLLTVHDALPSKANDYRGQPVLYEQNRPRFEATFTQGGRTFRFWFLFDTGRDGTMLIGEDFTGQDDNWNRLEAFRMVNGRKIVRLDAEIGGQSFKDIVTNAADPAKPGGRPTLFGNQVLNHFNMILDNTTGLLYLKPNARTDASYSRYEAGPTPPSP